MVCPPVPVGPPPGEVSLQPLLEVMQPDSLVGLFAAVLLEQRVLLRVRLDNMGRGGLAAGQLGAWISLPDCTWVAAPGIKRSYQLRRCLLPSLLRSLHSFYMCTPADYDAPDTGVRLTNWMSTGCGMLGASAESASLLTPVVDMCAVPASLAADCGG
jgi:hypothetical protein